MKIVILGAGQVGRTAAHHLSREEANEVTVVDINEDILRDLQDRLDIRTVAGNASYPSVLEAAGAAEADIIVALTNSDEVNMMACEVAYTLYRTPTKIARIRSAEYTSRPELFSDEALSVDVFISPEQLVTEYVERLIQLSGRAAGARFRRRQGAARRRARAARAALLVGHACASCRSICPKLEARVVAIYRAGRSISPEGDTVIEDGDEVFFLAAQQRHPPRHERDAQAGRPGAARRHRRRRQHRLPARQGAREKQPGEAHRARYATRAQASRSCSRTPSC